MDMRVLAGESGRIPLGDLVRAGVILPGDVWRYTFVFGKGADRFVVDKEVRVRSSRPDHYATSLTPLGPSNYWLQVDVCYPDWHANFPH